MNGDLFVLAAEGAHKSSNRSNPIGWSNNASSSTGTELPWLMPASPTSWQEQYQRLTFIVSIIGTAGTAPSAWSMQARFEYKLPHTVGYQYQYPMWQPFDAYNLKVSVEEQAGWAGGAHPVPLDGSYGIIADNTDGLSTAIDVPLPGGSLITPTATRATVMRTVRLQGAAVRVALLPSITGGDTTTRIMGSVNVQGSYT